MSSAIKTGSQGPQQPPKPFPEGPYTVKVLKAKSRFTPSGRAFVHLLTETNGRPMRINLGPRDYAWLRIRGYVEDRPLEDAAWLVGRVLEVRMRYRTHEDIVFAAPVITKIH